MVNTQLQMREENLSHLPPGTRVIRDADCARFLSDPLRRLYLAPFLRGELTLTEFSAALAMPLNGASYWLKKLLAFGLIMESGQTKRRGRPIRRYSAVAPAFFVPFSATPAATLEVQLLAEGHPWFMRLVGALARERRDHPIGHGTLITRDPVAEHAVRCLSVPSWEDGITINAWLARPLQTEQAQALVQELEAVLDRYAALPEQTDHAGPSRPYLLHLGLAPED
ncbi:hypothetical protein ACFFLM_23010 [Deinococcus oregonensis]|uniref:ArsR family transcriptional regulator n=1 Tax=Deinococcus oregonensis TaxID=1805970 RepID=A0ABV6B546_9DEIO